MSDTSDVIMSVQELIDHAFPDEITNSTINFRLLKTVIIIVANQLRVLHRQVQVSVDNGAKRHKTSLHHSQAVSEIRLQIDDRRTSKRVGQEGDKRKTERGTKQDDKKKQIINSREERKLMEEAMKYTGEQIKGEGINGNREVDQRNRRIQIEVKKEQDEWQKERGVKMSTTKTTHYTSHSTEEPVDLDKDDLILQEGVSIRNTKDDDLEEIREREIRIISQRADSHEDPALSPSPMASVHSFGKENLLIVSPQGRAPRISVVTKDQFDELANAVHELQSRFAPIAVPTFPENAELIKALRSGASLTEAMAGLQMSAKVQALEKAFENMISILTELAKTTPGMNLPDFRIMGANFTKKGQPNKIDVPSRDQRGNSDWISRAEFNNAMQELYDEIVEKVKKDSIPTGINTKNTEVLLSQLERKIESLNYRERIENLEAEITEYAEKFINLDFSLSSQIGSYQEQLTQMQYQLETGIDNMVDKVAHLRTAPEALKELNTRLDSLQQDLDNSVMEQKDLKAFQNNMTLDLARIWKEIELIHDAKADREEIADILRDKAGIENLNGMVSAEEFKAVCGEIEAKISASYTRFNNQELVWQLALDDLTKLINQKGDWKHLCTLRDDINRHLNNLQDKIDMLIEVVGEPRAAAIRKKLFSDTDCVSCGTPAGMNVEVPVQRLPNFTNKRASADGAEAPSMPKEDGDHAGLCIPGRPVTHADLRNHICHRFCGGSHTLIPPVSRAHASITITQWPRTLTTTIGSDGKAYKTDEQIELKPCGQCNVTKATSPQNDIIDNANEYSKEPAARERNTSSFAIMEEMSYLAAPRRSEGSDYRAMPSFDTEIHDI